ncbi:MAG: GNAT family N-acetyltransferase [Gemmatimonadaceae bacterium]|nr:GNAT family N-acetyltransferase [Gemmatimonadaceae bacterium]
MLRTGVLLMSLPEIRAAREADRAAIERLLSSAQLPLDGLSEALPTMFVATEPSASASMNDAELVGVAGFEHCCDNALLRPVAVAPQWQGRGLGRALVERSIAEAESRGIHALYLLTMTAERYFPAFGFERVARESVPADIRETKEFREACPASATVMRRANATASTEAT